MGPKAPDQLTGCICDARQLMLLMTCLTDLRRRSLSEAKLADIARAIPDFCGAMKRRGKCRRGRDPGPPCLGIALNYIKLMLALGRCTPRQRLVYWVIGFTGLGEKGEAAAHDQ